MRRPTTLFVAAVLAGAALAGCGGGSDDGGGASLSSGGGVDKASACTAIGQTIQEIAASATALSGDPQAMAKAYSDGAAKIRSQAEGVKDDAVEEAADAAAEAVESFGRAAAENAGQVPDSTELNEAGVALRQACT